MMCGISTVQDKGPHLFPSRASGSDTHCTAHLEAGRITNYICGSYCNLKKSQNKYHVSQFLIQITTINISDTLKG